MLSARTLLLIGLASFALSTSQGMAAPQFPFPNIFAPPPPAAPAHPDLPDDADPYYSTPGGFDKDVDMSRTTRKEIADPTGEAPGTLTINTRLRKLFLSLPDGRAIEYRIAVGRQGFSWKGIAEIGRKAFWPGWTPPPEMLDRSPELPAHMDGSLGNPLGARALYLFQDKKDTLFRIHGTNEPNSIGKAVSSGCIRMLNADVMDLYQRVAKGTRVVVL
jgi:lipoprotein-anchoring transpeptidase ErfK/SrfK